MTTPLATRQQQLTDWAHTHSPSPIKQFTALNNDASFRKYYRLHTDHESLIAIDAPPNLENIPAYIHIAKALCTHGIHAPEILKADYVHGFLLVSDLGDQLLLPNLSENNAKRYYPLAIDAILQLQTIKAVHNYPLPYFDGARLVEGQQLFLTWFLRDLLKLSLDAQEQGLLQGVYQHLSINHHAQPQSFIHMDFHSRNLMILPNQALGILDFQDARLGPISYDLVSLLKDCYITWPREQVLSWLHYYYQKLMPVHFSWQQLIRWFDLTGLMRHLRILGTFSRLNLSYAKPQYIQDMPRILAYITEVAALYPEFHAFHIFIQTRLTPALTKVSST
jgi:aminoglycoside/choline kinase family phosphotransferase